MQSFEMCVECFTIHGLFLNAGHGIWRVFEEEVVHHHHFPSGQCAVGGEIQFEKFCSGNLSSAAEELEDSCIQIVVGSVSSVIEIGHEVFCYTMHES